MPKKSFKDNTANIDRFFSGAEQPDAEQETQKTVSTHNTQEPHKTQTTPKTHYRINLKLKPEFREYLEHESWKAHKSITEYINDLIQADKDTRDTTNI